MKIFRNLVMIVIVTLSFAGMTLAVDSHYVGAKKCKTCHKKESMGNGYHIWETSKHAESYKTLLTDEAKADAKKHGLTTSPEESMECLVCHVTAAGAPADKLGKYYKVEDGVSCESCHGPGSQYRKRERMQALRAEYKAGGNELAKKYQFEHGSESTCADRCHREVLTVDGKTYRNSFYRPLDIKEGMEKIAHPLPH